MELFYQLNRKNIDNQWNDIKENVLRELGDSETFNVLVVGGNSIRSSKQNNFYRGVVIPAFVREGFGHKDYVHEVLRDELLNGRSTKLLSVEEFATFIDQCLEKLFEIGGYLKEKEGELAIKTGVGYKVLGICECCGYNKATQRHHKFSQSDWVIDKYGKKLIDDDKNIQLVCHHCHSSHANPNLIQWNEKDFIENVVEKQE
jgi:hypothetical protein